MSRAGKVGEAGEAGPGIWDQGPWIAFADAEPTLGQDVILADPLDGTPGMGQTIHIRWPTLEPWILMALHRRVRYWRPARMTLHAELGWLRVRRRLMPFIIPEYGIKTIPLLRKTS